MCLQTYGKSAQSPSLLGEALLATDKWAPYFPNVTPQRRFFTEEEYQKLLKEAGFCAVSVRAVWTHTLFSDREALFHFVKPLLNFIRHLPDDKQIAFTEEIVDQIISLAPSKESGEIDFSTYSLYAYGVKPAILNN